MTCVFCDQENLAKLKIVFRNEAGLVFRDITPLTPGHSLIIPHRHVQSYFDLRPDEVAGLYDLTRQAKAQIDGEFKPDAYNIGINDDVAAGQTVPHLHIHLIPRYNGDMPDPRGGIRWMFPNKAPYLPK